MKNLREKNHITVTDAGFIYLTESGREIAEMIYERHRLLSDWLIRLGVSEETANEDACRMEHVISAESFEAIKRHVKIKDAGKTPAFLLLFSIYEHHDKRHT